ncbi:MAG: hypothetical protein ACPGNV_10755 [Mangrovicoccus sp.]
MTLIYRQNGDDSSEKIFAEAFAKFERASSALDTVVRQLEAGEVSEVGDVKKLVSSFETAAELTLKARQKLDERRSKQTGIVHDYAIDMDAAKLEIGRRLACLRNSSGA